MAAASSTDAVGGNMDDAATTPSTNKTSLEEEEHPWPYSKQMFYCVWLHIGLTLKAWRSAALASRQFRRSHTFDVLAGVLSDIHLEYGIKNKIVRTTTTRVPTS